MRTLLIDGDINIFQVASAIETPIHWGDGVWTLHCFEEQGKNALDSSFAALKEKLEADEIIVALSDTTNFRYSVYPLYKHNRKGKRQPMLRSLLKEYVLDNYNTYLRPGLEGDDVLGILATAKKIVPGEKIIVSLDKDLRSIPGELYISERDEHITVSKEDAVYYHMYQTLIGDTADGYPGCPGYGPKSAEKLLSEVSRTYEDMWPLVVYAYEQKGFSEEEALVMARIARICQREDYDFKKKEVILWQPPRS